MSKPNEWDGTLPEELQPTEDEAVQINRFLDFLGNCRGDEAIQAMQESDFRARVYHQAREETFHRIWLLIRELAPTTPSPEDRK